MSDVSRVNVAMIQCCTSSASVMDMNVSL
eukprot:SAG25_NODE_9909_length_353_cov_0.610236_1_plen_28_part_01